MLNHSLTSQKLHESLIASPHLPAVVIALPPPKLLAKEPNSLTNEGLRRIFWTLTLQLALCTFIASAVDYAATAAFLTVDEQGREEADWCFWLALSLCVFGTILWLLSLGIVPLFLGSLVEEERDEAPPSCSTKLVGASVALSPVFMGITFGMFRTGFAAIDISSFALLMPLFQATAFSSLLALMVDLAGSAVSPFSCMLMSSVTLSALVGLVDVVHGGVATLASTWHLILDTFILASFMVLNTVMAIRRV